MESIYIYTDTPHIPLTVSHIPWLYYIVLSSVKCSEANRLLSQSPRDRNGLYSVSPVDCLIKIKVEYNRKAINLFLWPCLPKLSRRERWQTGLSEAGTHLVCLSLRQVPFHYYVRIYVFFHRKVLTTC